MPPKIRSRGRYRNRSPSPPRPRRKSYIEKRFHIASKQDEEKIINALRVIPTINYHYWSQRKHVNGISYFMKENQFQPEAAFYAYKNEHDKRH
jgi:hypothetical protein